MKKIINFILLNKAFFQLFAISLLAYFLSCFFNTIVSRFIDPDAYGDFSITFRSLTVLSLLLLAGTNTSSVKYLSSYFDAGDFKGFQHFLNWNVKIVRRGSIIFILLFVLFYLTLILLHLLTIKNFTSYHYSVYAFFLAPFSAVCIIMASILLSMKRNNTYLFFNQISTNILLSVFLLTAVFLLETSIHYFGILIFLFSALCIIIVAESILIKTVLKHNSIRLKPRVENLKESEKKLWEKDSRNYTSVQIVYRLIFIIDLLIVEWVHPGEHNVGYYAAMLVIGEILWGAPRSITSFLAPRISPLLKQKDYNALQELLNRVNMISFSISGLLLSLIVIFSESLLSLFGPDYPQAQIPLIVLCLGYFLGSSSSSNARILMFVDSRMILRINVFELTLLIISGIILTYFFGLIGMSFSVLISSTIKAVVMAFKLKAALPIKPYGFV